MPSSRTGRPPVQRAARRPGRAVLKSDSSWRPQTFPTLSPAPAARTRAETSAGRRKARRTIHMTNSSERRDGGHLP